MQRLTFLSGHGGRWRDHYLGLLVVSPDYEPIFLLSNSYPVALLDLRSYC